MPTADTPESMPPSAAHRPYVREGFFGQLGEGMPARLEIISALREPDRTALRMAFTPLDARPRSIDAFGVRGLTDSSLSGIQLLDPVGQRIYYPLTRSDSRLLGTRFEVLHQWRPRVTYELVSYFARLPEETSRVTVLTPGSTGEYTGIPVTDVAAAEPVPTNSPPPNPAQGDRIVLPVVREPLPPNAPSHVADLYGITERVVQRRERTEEVETVGLRADVLFGFDEATLDATSRTVLAEVIAETRRRADPRRPPIAVIGHTDGIGTDSYNQALSERRAQAVREVLESELGSGYAFATAGRGSSQPLAEEGGPDDAEARALNRRVEISYRYLESSAPADSETREPRQERSQVADPGEPAVFQSSETEPVVTTPIEFHAVGNATPSTYTLEIHPFRRDGAYLVASFDLVHRTGPTPFIGTTLLGHNQLRAGFAEFSAVDRNAGVIYRDVRFGTADSFRRIGPIVWPHVLAAGGTNRGYLYLPAPPPEITELAFNAGRYGIFDGVPIR